MGVTERGSDEQAPVGGEGSPGREVTGTLRWPVKEGLKWNMIESAMEMKQNVKRDRHGSDREDRERKSWGCGGGGTENVGPEVQRWEGTAGNEPGGPRMRSDEGTAMGGDGGQKPGEVTEVRNGRGWGRTAKVK